LRPDGLNRYFQVTPWGVTYPKLIFFEAFVLKIWWVPSKHWRFNVFELSVHINGYALQYPGTVRIFWEKMFNMTKLSCVFWEKIITILLRTDNVQAMQSGEELQATDDNMFQV
jgi:hypothetical protein